jgi:hypothetical protein
MMWRVQETAAARSVVAWKSREPCPFNSGGKNADCVAGREQAQGHVSKGGGALLTRRRGKRRAPRVMTRQDDERGMAGRHLEPILSIERLNNYNGDKWIKKLKLF